MTKKEARPKKNGFILISFLILFLLFNEFVWNKYIVNPTAWDALEEKPGQGGTGWEIDSDNMLAVLYPENGFHLYLVSKGYWGWTIKDEIAIQNEKNSAPFTAEKQSLKLKGKDEIDVIFIVSHDKEIEYFIARDGNGDSYHFNKTFNKESPGYLHYTYSEEKIPGDLTYEAYSADDRLLYTE